MPLYGADNETFSNKKYSRCGFWNHGTWHWSNPPFGEYKVLLNDISDTLLSRAAQQIKYLYFRDSESQKGL
jgi:hypothetical protein